MKKPQTIPKFHYWCEIDGDGFLINTNYGPDSAAEDAMEQAMDEGYFAGENIDTQIVYVEDWRGDKFVVEVYVDWSPTFTGYIKK